MDHFDDIQVEEYYHSDFAEEAYDQLFDEDEDDSFFQRYLKSNYDY